uniref:Glypican-2 n=1 Tax=Heterorhabditis bacteriophora TaxID=37862 RepID=A0A1I7XV07_HETBA
MGCAMTKTGLMNYCLCSGDMCNKDGLLQQAQLNGVRESLQTNLVAVHPSKVPESIPPKLSAAHIPPPVFLDADEPPNFLDNNLHDIGLSNEERDLLNRRRQWAEADLKSYRSVLSYFWVFITVIYLFT